jgi:hypothetical protein
MVSIGVFSIVGSISAMGRNRVSRVVGAISDLGGIRVTRWFEECWGWAGKEL